jgi:hypothetical protein
MNHNTGYKRKNTRAEYMVTHGLILFSTTNNYRLAAGFMARQRIPLHVALRTLLLPHTRRALTKT